MIQCLRRWPVTIHTRPSGRSTHRSPIAQPPRRSRSNERSTLGYASIVEFPRGRACPARHFVLKQEPDEKGRSAQFRITRLGCR
jgi:hypothetical protein